MTEPQKTEPQELDGALKHVVPRWDAARTERTLAGAGDDIRLRFDNGACPTAAPAAPASPAAAKTSWIGRWLGRAGSSQPWRIRL